MCISSVHCCSCFLGLEIETVAECPRLLFKLPRTITEELAWPTPVVLEVEDGRDRFEVAFCTNLALAFCKTAKLKQMRLKGVDVEIFADVI